MKYLETVTGYSYDAKDAIERILDPVSLDPCGQIEQLQDRVDTLTEVLGRFLLLCGVTDVADLNTLAGYKRFEVVE